MLDRLFGRAALKERIAELEEKTEHLERQLEAESERRSDAVTKRQEAEERTNRLEDRIEQLRDRAERAEAQSERAELTFRHEEACRGSRREAVLHRLRTVEAAPDGALTAFVTEDGSIPDAVKATLEERVTLIRDQAPVLIVADDAGLVAAALEPPLEPAPFAEWGSSFRLPAEWFGPTGRFGFGLVRSDTFAYGVYEGSERVEFDGFDSDIMADHSKGGFSQARFERRRDEQIQTHLDEVRDTLEASKNELDRTILVGEQTVLTQLEDLVDVTATANESGHDRDALNAAFSEFWTTRIYGL